jgi:hypothetical protein
VMPMMTDKSLELAYYFPDGCSRPGVSGGGR